MNWCVTWCVNLYLNFQKTNLSVSLNSWNDKLFQRSIYFSELFECVVMLGWLCCHVTNVWLVKVMKFDGLSKSTCLCICNQFKCGWHFVWTLKSNMYFRFQMNFISKLYISKTLNILIRKHRLLQPWLQLYDTLKQEITFAADTFQNCNKLQLDTS